ncbi:MAG: P27 family phage terminase small subunit [Hespellia sp.]|nr:P27 family phage terminase small subunit [Hespellia sp.]
MAKDGTARGGARPRSGPKKKALTEKISAGSGDRTLIEFPDTPDMEGIDMPPIKDYLKAKQKNGGGLCAEDVYKETYAWLKARGCERIVNSQLIEQYAMSVSRWIQCEDAISEFGFLAKHPTTGNAIQSPYVAMSQSYMKQVNQSWYQIFQIVKENCTVEFSGNTPQDDVMERLLRARKGN